MTLKIPHITTTDYYAFNDDYAGIIRNTLVKNPEINQAVFTIFTDPSNLNPAFYPNKNKLSVTEVTVEIDAAEIMGKYKTVRGATKAILKEIFAKYKQYINIH